MRFSAFGGRAGIYARVTAQRLRGALALAKTKAAFMRWLLIKHLVFSARFPRLASAFFASSAVQILLSILRFSPASISLTFNSSESIRVNSFSVRVYSRLVFLRITNLVFLVFLRRFFCSPFDVYRFHPLVNH